MTEPRTENIKEISRFHDNDTKGNRSREYIKQVESQNADINTVDAKGRTPLYLASWLGHAKATEEILKHKSISLHKGKGLDGLTPFSIASQKGHKKVVSLLANHSYQNDNNFNSSWLSDNWTGQYSRYKLDRVTTSMVTSTSNEILIGWYLFLGLSLKLKR